MQFLVYFYTQRKLNTMLLIIIDLEFMFYLKVKKMLQFDALVLLHLHFFPEENIIYIKLCIFYVMCLELDTSN